MTATLTFPVYYIAASILATLASLSVMMDTQKSLYKYEIELLEDISQHDPEHEGEIMVGMIERDEETTRLIVDNMKILDELHWSGQISKKEAEERQKSLLYLGSEYVRVLEEIKDRQRFQSALLHWQFLVDKALLRAKRRLNELNETSSNSFE